MIEQIVDACDLVAALDRSVDSPYDPTVFELWEHKFNELTDAQIDSILAEQKYPICVKIAFVDEGIEWTQGNGHHRLAVKMFACEPVHVLFNDETNDWMVISLTSHPDEE